MWYPVSTEFRTRSLRWTVADYPGSKADFVGYTLTGVTLGGYRSYPPQSYHTEDATVYVSYISSGVPLSTPSSLRVRFLSPPTPTTTPLE